MHACFGPRHGRDTYTSHTRATANRWGEDDSLCTCESNYGLSSSLSILISNQPTSTTPLLPGHLVPAELWSSGFLNHCDNEHRLRRGFGVSIAEFACRHGGERMSPNWEHKRKSIAHVAISTERSSSSKPRQLWCVLHDFGRLSVVHGVFSSTDADITSSGDLPYQRARLSVGARVKTIPLATLRFKTTMQVCSSDPSRLKTRTLLALIIPMR